MKTATPPREVALMRELGLSAEQAALAAPEDHTEDEDDVTEDVNAYQAA